jgi:hypothetical protein
MSIQESINPAVRFPQQHFRQRLISGRIVVIAASLTPSARCEQQRFIADGRPAHAASAATRPMRYLRRPAARRIVSAEVTGSLFFQPLPDIAAKNAVR